MEGKTMFERHISLLDAWVGKQCKYSEGGEGPFVGILRKVKNQKGYYIIDVGPGGDVFLFWYNEVEAGEYNNQLTLVSLR